MPEGGHVFVVRGDITSLICDWWLLPCGTKAGKRGDVSHHWLKQDPDLNHYVRHGRLLKAPSGSDRAVLVRTRAEDRPGVIAVHTGDRGDEYPEWFAEAIRDAVSVAKRQPHPGTTRGTPLRIACPLVGTGAGGAGPRRAGVVEALMEQALAATTQGVDIIFVVLDAQAFSAMQRYRAQSPRKWWPFARSARHWKAAERLADHARAGTLVPFIGAGVSQAAGLDSWAGLLDALAKDVGITSRKDLEALHRLDARDAGRLLDLRLQERRDMTLSEAIRSRYADKRQPSLTHALLASLPIREAVTTNYDRLFEAAWQNAVGDPRSGSTAKEVRTLPRHTGPAPRWLLKIHGDIDDDRPLVLSRDEYARLEQSGGALTGVLQALLMTRHLLIVGYGLTDETFQRVAHDIRGLREQSAMPSITAENNTTRVGTTLLVRREALGDELWLDDLHVHSMWQRDDGNHQLRPIRRLEILLDLVAHLAAPAESYLLGDGLLELSREEPDASVRRHLVELEGLTGDKRLAEPLRRALRETIERFGGTVR